jgi:hypothetical protein
MKVIRKNNDKFVCEECYELLPHLHALSVHTRNMHKEINYFKKWLEDENDGKCKICNEKTKFISLGQGYKNCCSRQCAIKYSQLRLEEENLKKFGIKNTYQRLDVLKKKRITNLQKLGVEFPMQSNICKEKRRQTYLKNIGVESPMKSVICREKSKITCKKLYGVENISQSDKIKRKKEETCYKNYGVKHPIQNKEILEKAQKKSFSLKLYKNTKLYYQASYELDFLNKFYNKFSDIQRGLSINYKNCVYHPDFYIPSLNLMIEIKSSWWYKIHKENIIEKEKATIASGFKYIIILDKNYEDFNKFLIIQYNILSPDSFKAVLEK